MNRIRHATIAAILCLQTICRCVISTVGQYIYASYLQIYPFSSNDTDPSSTIASTTLSQFHTQVNSCPTNTSSGNAQLWAQEQSADLFFRIDLWNSCPMIVMTLLLGIYTPKLGRRFVLLLPMLGTICQLAIWLTIIYARLGDKWWYLASFLVGLSGSNNVLNFVLSLIIADSTDAHQRSWYFVYFEALTTIVAAVATFAIGYYIDWRGFTDLYWISLGLQIISIGIVLIGVKESAPNVSERTPLLPSSLPQWKNRTSRISLSLLFILVAYVFYLLAYSTYASFLWYLLDTPFCWSSEQVGNYNAVSSVACALFSLLGMKFLVHLGASDAIICTLSHLFFALSSLWIAFARYSWQLYAGLLISPYADYQNSLTLPMISKWLAASERNTAFTLVTLTNTIITTFGDAFFNWFYAQTVSHHRNLTLLLAAGFSGISLLFSLCLVCVRWRMSDDTYSIASRSKQDSASSDEAVSDPLLDATSSDVSIHSSPSNDVDPLLRNEILIR